MFPRFSVCETENSKPVSNPVNSSRFFVFLPSAGVTAEPECSMLVLQGILLRSIQPPASVPIHLLTHLSRSQRSKKYQSLLCFLKLCHNPVVLFLFRDAISAQYPCSHPRLVFRRGSAGCDGPATLCIPGKKTCRGVGFAWLW